MRKKTAKWFIAATLLVVFGLLIFVLTACAAGWDFTKLGTGKYVTNSYEIYEEFENISIKTDTADIVFALSNDEKSKVVCYEEESKKHSVSAMNGVLTIDEDDARKWYEHISLFSFSAPKITVYLPKMEYASLVVETDTGDIEIPKDFQLKSIDISVSTGDVNCYATALEGIKIKATTGSVQVEGISTKAVDLSTSTGKITVSDIACEGDLRVAVSTGKTYLTGVTCKNVISDGDTGDIFLKYVIATEKFSIERSTGDVSFEECDAAEIFVETDTGDVKGTLLSEKVFIPRSDTGAINVPETATGGRCEITTDTGDIKIQIIKR